MLIEVLLEELLALEELKLEELELDVELDELLLLDVDDAALLDDEPTDEDTDEETELVLDELSLLLDEESPTPPQAASIKKIAASETKLTHLTFNMALPFLPKSIAAVIHKCAR